MAFIRRVSLGTLLLAALVFEFSFGRIFINLARDELIAHPGVFSGLMWMARFGFFFLSSLAVVLFGVLLFRIIQGEPRFLRRQARISLLLVGGVLFLFALELLLFRASAQFLFHVRCGSVCFGLLAVLSLWITEEPVSLKAGATLLWLAVSLTLGPLLIMPFLRDGALSFSELGQTWVLLLGTAGALLVAFAQGLLHLRLVTSTILFFVGAVMLRWLSRDTLSQLSWPVFAINWPLELSVALIYLALCAIWSSLILFALLAGGRTRLVGIALGLFFFSGLHTERIDTLVLFAMAFFLLLKEARPADDFQGEVAPVAAS